MYSLIKTVIKSGNYELKDILGKIDTMWLSGKLTEDERTELCELAREGATPEMGYASVDTQLENLKARIDELEAKVKALEASADNPDEGAEETPEEPDEYPAWHQPTGAHDAYYAGDKMTYTDGKRYECIAPEGYGCAYAPDVLPGMWKVLEE